MDFHEDSNGELHYAAEYGLLNKMMKIISEGEEDLNTKHGIDENTALHNASRNGYLECVKCLVSGGADINVQNYVGMTPLMFAALKCRLECVKYLISVGAKTDIVDIGGKQVLFHACLGGNVEIVNFLLSTEGVDVNKYDLCYETPLFAAALSGEPKVYGILILNGADPNVMNDQGETPHDILIRVLDPVEVEKFDKELNRLKDEAEELNIKQPDEDLY